MTCTEFCRLYLGGLYGDIESLYTNRKSEPKKNRKAKATANNVLELIKNQSHAFVMGYAEAPGEIRNLITQIGLKIEEIQKNDGFKGGIKRWIWGSSTEKALVKVSKALGNLIPVKKDSKYGTQIILRASDSDSAKVLQYKALKQGLPSTIVNITDAEIPENVRLWSELTHEDRVIITAHGSPEDPNRVSFSTKFDPSTTYDVNHFVNILKKHAKKLQVPEANLNGRRIKISLQICHGATESRNENINQFETSFAQELSRALAKAGIPAEVIGRRGVAEVNINPDNFQVRKLVDEKHKAPGSKFSFVTDQNMQTTRVNVYYTNHK